MIKVAQNIKFTILFSPFFPVFAGISPGKALGNYLD
jgi:hypothetical protein